MHPAFHAKRRADPPHLYPLLRLHPLSGKPSQLCACFL
jgi:hypothetical protein